MKSAKASPGHEVAHPGQALQKHATCRSVDVRDSWHRVSFSSRLSGIAGLTAQPLSCRHSQWQGVHKCTIQVSLEPQLSKKMRLCRRRLPEMRVQWESFKIKTNHEIEGLGNRFPNLPGGLGEPVPEGLPNGGGWGTSNRHRSRRPPKWGAWGTGSRRPPGGVGEQVPEGLQNGGGVGNRFPNSKFRCEKVTSPLALFWHSSGYPL